MVGIGIGMGQRGVCALIQACNPTTFHCCIQWDPMSARAKAASTKRHILLPRPLTPMVPAQQRTACTALQPQRLHYNLSDCTATSATALDSGTRDRDWDEMDRWQPWSLYMRPCRWRWWRKVTGDPSEVELQSASCKCVELRPLAPTGIAARRGWRRAATLVRRPRRWRAGLAMLVLAPHRVALVLVLARSACCPVGGECGPRGDAAAKGGQDIAGSGGEGRGMRGGVAGSRTLAMTTQAGGAVSWYLYRLGGATLEMHLHDTLRQPAAHHQSTDHKAHAPAHTRTPSTSHRDEAKPNTHAAQHSNPPPRQARQAGRTSVARRRGRRLMPILDARRASGTSRLANTSSFQSFPVQSGFSHPSCISL